MLVQFLLYNTCRLHTIQLFVQYLKKTHFRKVFIENGIRKWYTILFQFFEINKFIGYFNVFYTNDEPNILNSFSFIHIYSISNLFCNIYIYIASMLLSGLAMVTFMLFLTGNYGTLLPPGFCACALINRAIVLTFSEINAVY